ncbi:MAG: hypothetical protein ACFFBH_08550 [Promethearchaeota archaeon]
MKKINTSRILILLLFLALFAGFYSTRFLCSTKIVQNNKYKFPKSNANEIIIISPDNVTYTSSMSGYFPATYGFENDEIGTTDQNIAFIDSSNSSSGCTAEIFDEIDNHKQILQLTDTNLSGRYDFFNQFGSNQQAGSIEYWIYTPDASLVSALNLYQGSEARIFVRIGEDHFQYRQPSYQFANICPALDNTWYHVRIDFECSSGGYMGLSADTFFIWINDVKYGPYNFRLTATAIEELRLASNEFQDTSLAYYDAIGYSWDPYYSIGENLNVGLLLSFENNTSLDWIGYSLDGSANRTILGNSTLSMPNNGHHNIQIIGNDTLGTTFASDIRHFTINIQYINIITPANTTYTSLMSGYYPATYGFENDEIGTTDQNIAFIDSSNSSSGCTAEIFDEIDNHKQILQLTDTNLSGRYDFFNQFGSNQQAGSIEYWIYTPDASLVSALNLYQGSEARIFVRIGEDHFQYRQPSYQFANICPALDNTWYHVRIDFECGGGGYMGLSADTFFIWINDVKYGPYNFRLVATAIGEIRLASNDLENTSLAYYDAFGYSWDPYYSIGINLNEGLLLNFEKHITLDWIGYSLDGSAYKTIMGNSTISMPNNGYHNIQIFGNDTLGTMYTSDIRYFTINIQYINIITPANTTYTSPMNGYYPATYGFENDEIGTTDQNIAFIDSSNSSSGCTAEIFDEIDNHKQILQLTDTNLSGRYDFFNQFGSNQQAGSIEYWIYTPDASLVSALNLYQGSEARIFVRIGEDHFQYRQPSYQFANICPALDNTWYHVRIDFECGGGGYMGLSADTFFIWINDVKYGPYNFRLVATAIGEIRLASNDLENTSLAYYDAFGYSWDPYYSIGINLNEGLLLNFEKHITLDWIGYSLDGSAYKTIMGNSTISMPNNGYHNIQIFGNNTLGTMYTSDIRYFTIGILPPQVSIVSPTAGQYFSDPPSFILSITATNLVSSWYTLNGGTDIQFIETTGTINFTAWNSLPDGPVTIRFYARDIVDQEDFDEVTIMKDTISPVVMINSPIAGQQFTGLPPSYNITVVESNLDQIWYTLDDGFINITISQLIGSIDSAVWNNAPYGAITIRFYASDHAGNIQYREVEVIKNAPEVPPGIPGYNVLLLIGVSLLLIGIVIKRTIKS